MSDDSVTAAIQAGDFQYAAEHVAADDVLGILMLTLRTEAEFQRSRAAGLSFGPLPMSVEAEVASGCALMLEGLAARLIGFHVPRTDLPSVRPSGDATGTTDTANLNAAFRG